MDHCSILQNRQTCINLIASWTCPDLSTARNLVVSLSALFAYQYFISYSCELHLRQLFSQSTFIQQMTDSQTKTLLMDCVASSLLDCLVYRAPLNVGSVGNCLATKASSGNQRTTPLHPRETVLPVQMMSSPGFDRRRKGDIWLRAACHLHNERSLCKP